MKAYEREQLMTLLAKLISAQDDVTHLSEQGPEHQKETVKLIAVRNGIRNKIITFVEGLTA